MLGGSQLDAALRSIFSRPFRQTFFRASPARFRDDPFGRARTVAANRFNVAGGARVLYLSEKMTTCLEETQAAGFPASAVVVVPVELDLRAVIDLRDPSTLAALQLSEADVAFNFRSLPIGAAPSDTQLVGERFPALGCVDGILFPSFARRPPMETNLAVIEATLPVLGSSIAVNDPSNNLRDRLP